MEHYLLTNYFVKVELKETSLSYKQLIEDNKSYTYNNDGKIYFYGEFVLGNIIEGTTNHSYPTNVNEYSFKPKFETKKNYTINKNDIIKLELIINQ